MFKFLVLVVVATVASAATISPRRLPWSPTGRIVGGEDTTIEEVPYQVAIQEFGYHSCGGTIISKNYVLTAGHCVGSPLSAFNITAGSADRTKGGSHHSVAETVLHEGYDIDIYGSPYNDIALIRVNEPFEFDETRQPIELFDEAEETPVGAPAIITGWGMNIDEDLPEVLQTVTIPIVSKESCSEAYIGWEGLRPGQICAAYPEGGKDACVGDSGGPLTVNNRLAGIVSWGNGCAEAGQPGVYAEVAFFRAWIKAHSGI